jgi:hypothetical protein
MGMAEYPAAQVGKLLDDALSGAGRRGPRRTKREAAADRLVDAIAALIAEGVEPGDQVAFEDARAAAERYRRSDA